MSVADPDIVAAGSDDAHPLTACIAIAFQPLAVARWLVADPDERLSALYGSFRIVVEHALRHGRVWTVAGYHAVAVWLPYALDAPVPDIPDYAHRLVAACGAHTERFRILEAHLAARHPDAGHQHLTYLAVHPARQNAGLGSALLRHHHRYLDRSGTPAYLEASSPDARRLYLRHGYTGHGPPVELPQGPRMWPMWRAPRAVPVQARGERPQ